MTSSRAARPPSPPARVAGWSLFVVVSVVAGVAGGRLAAAVRRRLGHRDPHRGRGLREPAGRASSTPPLPQRSVILAADGSRLATVYYQNRIEVPLTKIAPVMRQAIVADRGRAGSTSTTASTCAGSCARAAATSGGGQVQGGSTLTQQYVKQVLDQRRRRHPRRCRPRRPDTLEPQAERAALRARPGEAVLQGRDPRALPQHRLLRRRRVRRRGRRRGATSARAPADLTLVEAATLAGIVQQPIGYDPLRNPAASQTRRDDGARAGWSSRATSPPGGRRGREGPDEVVPASRRTVSNGCTSSSAPFFCDYVAAGDQERPRVRQAPRPTARRCCARAA